MAVLVACCLLLVARHLSLVTALVQSLGLKADRWRLREFLVTCHTSLH
jgi:hypothetical protein